MFPFSRLGELIANIKATCLALTPGKFVSVSSVSFSETDISFKVRISDIAPEMEYARLFGENVPEGMSITDIGKPFEYAGHTWTVRGRTERGETYCVVCVNEKGGEGRFSPTVVAQRLGR